MNRKKTTSPAAGDASTSFGGKARKFMRRLALGTTFAGAVAGVGYHGYGTQEEITARVTQVDVQADGAGGVPRVVIHTDKGTFSNTTSWLHRKDAQAAQGISNILRPGATVRLHVYGIQPEVAGFSLDDLGIHRNIISVRVLTPPPVRIAPPAAASQAPPAAPAVTLLPPLATPVPSDNSLPRVCVDNADIHGQFTKAQQLYRDLALLQRLPLTGSGVFDMLVDAKHDLRTCLDPQRIDNPMVGSYTNGRLRLARGAGSGTSLHEFFHAYQEKVSGLEMEKLDMRDAAVGNFLLEATAVAYELAAEREAQNRGVKLAEDAPVLRVENGIQVSYRVTSAASDPLTRMIFKSAYDDASALYANIDARTREAKSLEAAGKAVVRHLLAASDPTWAQSYVQLVLLNINANTHIYEQNNAAAAGYAAERTATYFAMGQVSSLINFVPDEFLGADADRHIARCLERMGLEIVAPPPAAAADAGNVHENSAQSAVGMKRRTLSPPGPSV